MWKSQGGGGGGGKRVSEAGNIRELNERDLVGEGGLMTYLRCAGSNFCSLTHSATDVPLPLAETPLPLL